MKRNITFEVIKFSANQYVIKHKGYVARIVDLDPSESIQIQLQRYIQAYYVEVMKGS